MNSLRLQVLNSTCNMKSILIIANFASIHIYNYVRNTIDSKNNLVKGLSMSPISSIPSDYLKYYQENNIDVVEESTLPEDSNQTKIKKIKNQLASLGEFDILHIHYVKHLYAPGIFFNRKHFRKIILSFWGSDFYRSSIISRAFVLPILRIADNITFITSNMKDDFIKKSIFHQGLENRICVLDYGNMLFPYIDSAKDIISKDRINVYSSFNLSPDKITVTVGYVGREQMQQKKAIDSFVAHSDRTLYNNVQFVIPAYGMNENTLTYLEQTLTENKISHCIISEFLELDRVALLRSITDVFVHPQTTDAFSSSMQECFYANAIIVNGEWLHYKDAENAGAFFLKFNSFDKLPLILDDIVKHINFYKEKSSINKSIMLNLCSWDMWRSKWQNLYE